MIWSLALACSEKAVKWDESVEISVNASERTAVEIGAFMELNRTVASATMVVRVTPMLEQGDRDIGHLTLAPGWEDTDPALMEDTSILDSGARLDGVLESAISTRPGCQNECWVGYCKDATDCEVPFTLQIEPRDQEVDLDLLIEMRIVNAARPECGFCELDLTAEVR